MTLDPDPRGNVLILAGQAQGERLRQWVESAGEAAVFVGVPHERVFERSDEETIDLVVTELDANAPEGRLLLDRLLDGDLLFGIPQLHLLRDPTLHGDLTERNPDVAAMAMPAATDASEFQARVRLAAEIGRLRRELSRSTIHDELTGAYNRRYVLMRLEQEIARSRRHGNPASLVLLEVDGLEQINDCHGIDAGDRVLMQVAELIRPRMRREDIFGRWDGATFALLLSSSPHHGASVYVEKLRAAAEAERLSIGAQHVPIRFSAGIASTTTGSRAVGSVELVRAAQRALTRARAVGGDRVFIDPGVLDRPRLRVVIADDDPALADPAHELLALDDYEVLRVETGDALLDLLGSERPDLVVLGLHLVGATGNDIALVERIHTLFAQKPVPIVGLAPAQDGRPLTATGRSRVDRYLTKPFSLSVLRSVIRELTAHEGPSGGRPV